MEMRMSSRPNLRSRVAIVVIMSIVALTGQSAQAVEGVPRALPAAVPSASGPVQRVAGADRYQTSAAISASTFAPGVPVAYIATGLVFSDAVSGGAAGGARGGPVLLTMPDALPGAIRSELSRLKPAKIVVLGGTG